MTREIIPITSEQQWLDLRLKDITSTKMSALLDMSPYGTPFEIYHAHKSGVHVPFEATERTEKGKRMEGYIAQEVALITGWEVKPLNVYIRIPELNMGSSFDFEYTKPCGTKGILEIKGVDYFQYKEKWIDNEAPAHIEIQVQHQLECADVYEEATIAAATSIYDIQLHHRERDREFGSALKTTVKKFWADIEAGNEPKPNFYRDSKVIAELYKSVGADKVDKTSDEYLDALIAKRKRLQDEITAMEKESDATKTEIHSILANAGGAFTNNFEVTATWTKDTPDKIITADMVGQTISGRKGYRQLRIKSLNKSTLT